MQARTIRCSVDYDDDLENSEGWPVGGVTVTCSKCRHTTESYGQGEKSVKRCLLLLHQECPLEEENFYRASDRVDQ